MVAADKNENKARGEHSKELIKAFTPIRFFLVIIGQMPFDIKKKVRLNFCHFEIISDSYGFLTNVI